MKTKEELLKIYSSYLPYELKIETDKGVFELNAIDLIYEYPLFAKTQWDKEKLETYPKINIRDSGSGFGFKANKVKPILYSMDYLTKEIEHKGEKFVPQKKLSHLDLEWLINSDNLILKTNYEDVLQLIEWHFNIFNLSETEYIKKKL